MGMWSSSDFFKRSLNYMTSQVARLTVCSTRPATVAEAWNTVMIAKSSAAVVAAPASTTNGWVVRSTQLANLVVPAGHAGTADHVALLSVGASSVMKLLYVTTCGSKALTTSDTVTVPAWRIRIANPTSS